ncbi:site-specific integrase [Pseudanabaena sp. FACHB-2040]|uniref:site-specific integrase n=1 Tax=Pseudanabaena sp. FACHB-2040 TaxID=2692859 RepID=UPI0016888672|nr:site-specific integrase [Pseudanabaena sp. FACHB-2040]MBD2261414.1 site-specific integrase [Pseudanabaena sp. FACHB-2040]
MGKRSVEDLLAEANASLKAARSGVQIVQVKGSNRLYLRATLPPKPNSSKDKPYQQRIALGVFLNPAGVKRSLADAQRLASDLPMGRFSWADWSATERRCQTCADWVEAFEQNYFQRRDRNPQSETTWEKDYQIPFRRLPADKDLSAELLVKVLLETTKPDTRARQRAAMAYGALARLAQLDANLTAYRGAYSPSSVNPRDLPSDQEILAYYDQIPSRPWQCVYALMATYGLRDHEVFFVDLEALKEPPGIALVQDGKNRKPHSVWPLPDDWWERFRLWDVELPRLTAKRNSDYGMRVSQYFNRNQMPFVPYDLRHCWAARAAVMGLDPSIAAKMMDHSLVVHNRIYQQFLNRDHMQQAWERARLNRPI